MGDLNIIDRFLATFIHYIDSGFGLLSGDVVALTSILIGIDVTLAGLFWALDRDGDVLTRLIQKTLYIGAFAFIIDNYQNLTTIIFNSFSTLGLDATPTGLSAADLLMPGKLAGTGFTAAYPLLQQAGSLIGFNGFFTHFVIIIVLLIAWFIVLLAFFILAVQLFIVILEYKLTALAGFVLVPFALWNRTSFLAERVLGNVVSSGVKVMVLAVIVGIGSTLFSAFTAASQDQQPSIAGAMSLVLAAIALLGLGIYGPAIATGLVSGAPQLGAGAVIGTAGAVAGAAFLSGSAALGGAGLIRAAGSGGMAAIRAGTTMASATSTSYGLGRTASGASGMSGIAAGMGGVARTGAGAMARSGRSMLQRAGSSLADSAQAGRQAAWRASGRSVPDGTTPPSALEASDVSQTAIPAWARWLQSEQRARHHSQIVTQTLKEGDRSGVPATPDLDQRED